MARIIPIDEDTIIGYSYPNKVYYITNKNTTTTRPTVQQALAVLNIVAPYHQVLEQDLVDLATKLETLEELSYTIEDTGKYIRTVQINTYAKNPITLDLDKQKLYIMNTNIIFDLTLNESSFSRADRMRDYYKKHLGIDLSIKDLTTIYDFLLDYKKTKPYVVLNKHVEKAKPITYSYQINLLNPTTIDYKLTSNIIPLPVASYPTIAHISSINSNRVVELLEQVPTKLAIGDTVYIDNSTTVVDKETSYSSNGKYTIGNIEDNYIKVVESIPTYKTPMTQCYLQQPVLDIEKVDRNTKVFTLTSPVPNSILIGDTIHVSNTTKTIDFQPTSIDGSYTVYSITNNLLTVHEDIPTDYTKEGTETPTLSKHVPLGEILSIKNRVITLTNTQLPTELNDLTILIDNKQYKVVSNTTNTITVEEHIEDYTPSYAELKVEQPTKEVLVNITKSDTENLPVGEFMVDNPQECIDYLKLGLADECVPTQDSFNKLGSAVEETTPIEIEGIESMHLLGLYSEVYTDKK